jgi:hypothetical protein
MVRSLEGRARRAGCRDVSHLEPSASSPLGRLSSSTFAGTPRGSRRGGGGGRRQLLAILSGRRCRRRHPEAGRCCKRMGQVGSPFVCACSGSPGRGRQCVACRASGRPEERRGPSGPKLRLSLRATSCRRRDPRDGPQPFSMEEGPPPKRGRRLPSGPKPPPFPPPRRADVGMGAAASSSGQPLAAVPADERDTSMPWGHAAIHADLREAPLAENLRVPLGAC